MSTHPTSPSFPCGQSVEFFYLNSDEEKTSSESSQPVGPSIPNDFRDSLPSAPAASSVSEPREEGQLSVLEWTKKNAPFIKRGLQDKLGECVRFTRNPIDRRGKFHFTYIKGEITEHVSLTCSNKQSLISLINRGAAFFELLSKEKSIYDHFCGFQIYPSENPESYIKMKYEIAGDEFKEDVGLNSSFTVSNEGKFLFDGKKLHEKIKEIFDRIECDLEELGRMDLESIRSMTFLRSQSQPMVDFSSQGIFEEEIPYLPKEELRQQPQEPSSRIENPRKRLRFHP